MPTTSSPTGRRRTTAMNWSSPWILRRWACFRQCGALSEQASTLPSTTIPPMRASKPKAASTRSVPPAARFSMSWRQLGRSRRPSPCRSMSPSPRTPAASSTPTRRPNTHRVAAALMDTGIDYRAANKRHFRTKTKKRLALEERLRTIGVLRRGARGRHHAAAEPEDSRPPRRTWTTSPPSAAW